MVSNWLGVGCPACSECKAPSSKLGFSICPRSTTCSLEKSLGVGPLATERLRNWSFPEIRTSSYRSYARRNAAPANSRERHDRVPEVYASPVTCCIAARHIFIVLVRGTSHSFLHIFLITSGLRPGSASPTSPETCRVACPADLHRLGSSSISNSICLTCGIGSHQSTRLASKSLVLTTTTQDILELLAPMRMPPSIPLAAHLTTIMFVFSHHLA